jgi:S1-C subfamily serine protease
VQDVTDGTPAARVGIRAGDVVVAVDGETITSAASLGGAIRQFRPGDEVEIELDRRGERITVRVVLGEAPTS